MPSPAEESFDTVLSPVSSALLGGALSGAEAPQLDARSWTHLLSDARRLGIIPQLARTWEADERCPKAVRSRLREINRRHVFWTMQLFDELGKVLEELERRNLEVIALKGAHLAELVYGDRTLRSMGDVDLLARPETLAELGRALTGLGYSQPSASDRRWSESSYYHVIYRHRHNWLPIELHWDVLPPHSPLRIDLEGWWDRSRTSSIAGRAVRILSPEDLLLSVIVHAGWKHRFEGCLRPFCDIQAIIARHPDLSWDKVAQEAEASPQTARCAALMLGAARSVGVAVPAEVLERLPPVEPPNLIDTALWRATSVRSQAWGEKLRLMETATGPRARLQVTISTLRYAASRLWGLIRRRTPRQRWREVGRQIRQQIRGLRRSVRAQEGEDGTLDRWLAGP